MKNLEFKPSAIASLGVELEFQIIDPHGYSLVSRAQEILHKIKKSSRSEQIKPEITQGMIEINSSVHTFAKDLYEELLILRTLLLKYAESVDVNYCGGGTHPFQKWVFQKIFPTSRFKKLTERYRYISKRSTVFGQHTHIGCPSGEDALYLMHALSRYVPQFITLSASSPFSQGIDTGFQSTRSNIFNEFPTSGIAPYLENWKEFSAYYYKMKNLGLIETMKDFYWDIRPKPEFGTVEVRVCDTPLTFKKSANIAAYIQAVSLYLLRKKPTSLNRDLYFLYSFNRFQAIRYGYNGQFVNPYSLKKCTISQDILNTLKIIKPYAKELKSLDCLEELHENVIKKTNDAIQLRKLWKKFDSLEKVVQKQCEMWRKK